MIATLWRGKTKQTRTTAGGERPGGKKTVWKHCAVAGLSVAMLMAYGAKVVAAPQGNEPVASGKTGQVATKEQKAQAHDRGVETLVLIRHGEKPAKGLGLLTCKGLNRALLLPDFFAANFDRPDYIFVPNPAVKATEIHGDGKRYDYVRPLLTIGPTAIRYGVPVNTQLPFNAPDLLADTLLDAKYHNDTIYVAWEHANLEEFAHIVLKRFGDETAVKEWANNDFDRYYVFRIDWNTVPATLKFEERSENLGAISEKCPEAAKP